MYKYLYKVFQHELFQCIFSFYFFSAEAFKTIKVHLMHIPIAQRNGTMTIGATRFAYVYKKVFQHVSYLTVFSAFTSSVLKLSKQSRYT